MVSSAGHTDNNNSNYCMKLKTFDHTTCTLVNDYQLVDQYYH